MSALFSSLDALVVIIIKREEKMKRKQRFDGTIIIGDPCNMVSTEEDWQKAKWGEKMDLLGFSDFLAIEFEEVSQKVVDGDGTTYGGFCTDSCMVDVLYLDELLEYNPDFRHELEKFPQNYAIVRDFKGEVTFRTKNSARCIVGTGNINFVSIPEE